MSRVPVPLAISAEVLVGDPDMCKFTANQAVHPGGPFFFENKESGVGSPLIEWLFTLPGVAHVLVAENVVTVGKESTASWSELKPAIGMVIRTQLLAGVPMLVEPIRTPDTQAQSAAEGRAVVQEPRDPDAPIELKRDCEAAQIPSGEKFQLSKGDFVAVTQALGGSFTVRTEEGRLVRIAVLDADALGLESTSSSEAPLITGPFSLENVIEKLKTVFDPEIPVNVVDLGLIYVCEAHPLTDGGHRVEIKMSMTAPGCGMGDVLKEDARAKLLTVPGVTDIDIEIVWEPAWDKSRMSEAAQLELGMF